MVRGTFANVREEPDAAAQPDGSRVEGGYTLLDGEQTTVFDASAWMARGADHRVRGRGIRHRLFARLGRQGHRAARVKAVVARSFERIHRSNLVGMGVLPLQFIGDDGWRTLGLDGNEKLHAGRHRRRSGAAAARSRCRSSAPTARGSPCPCCAASTPPDRDRVLPPRRHPALRAARDPGRSRILHATCVAGRQNPPSHPCPFPVGPIPAPTLHPPVGPLYSPP